MFGFAFRVIGVGGIVYVASKTVEFIAPHVRSAAEAVVDEVTAFKARYATKTEPNQTA